MYYPCGENKGADQLHGYREADLRLCFRICKKLVFSRRGSYLLEISDSELRYLGRKNKGADQPSGDFWKLLNSFWISETPIMCINPILVGCTFNRKRIEIFGNCRYFLSSQVPCCTSPSNFKIYPVSGNEKKGIWQDVLLFIRDLVYQIFYILNKIHYIRYDLIYYINILI